MLKILSAIIIFFFTINNSYSFERIAFIDLDYILKNSNIGKSILKDLEFLNNKNINELKKIELELKKKEDEIIKKKNIISKEQSQKDVELLKENIQKYKNLKNEMVLNVKKKKDESLNIFFKQINPIIQNYMDKNSIDILLERKNVFIGKTNSDITNSIIEEINKKLN